MLVVDEGHGGDNVDVAFVDLGQRVHCPHHEPRKKTQMGELVRAMAHFRQQERSQVVAHALRRRLDRTGRGQERHEHRAHLRRDDVVDVEELCQALDGQLAGFLFFLFYFYVRSVASHEKVDLLFEVQARPKHVWGMPCVNSSGGVLAENVNVLVKTGYCQRGAGGRSDKLFVCFFNVWLSFLCLVRKTYHVGSRQIVEQTRRLVL